MILEKVTHLSYDVFNDLMAQKKSFIIHPWILSRNLFLGFFLERDTDTLLYHRVTNDTKSIPDFLQSLISEIREATDNKFGKKTDAALKKNDASALGKALATDLAAVKSEQFTVLYLDEFDNLALTQELRDFTTALVENLADNTRLMINARIVTYHPWAKLVADGHTAVLGTTLRKDNVMFEPSDSNQPQLEIYALGRGHAIVNGRAITNWDGALPRNLFFFFVDRELVTRNEIFEFFWPKLNVKEATNVFHVTKRKITECITDQVVDDGNYELTRYGNGFYTPSNKVVRHYDVAEFEEAVEKAAMTFDDEQQGLLYRRAVELYKGPFLQTINMPWVIERRAKLQQLFVEALIGLGRIHKSAEEYDTALGYFIRALRELPQREDIHREVMTLYHLLNRKDDALAQYQLLSDKLKASLGVAPDNATRELFEQIKSS